MYYYQSRRLNENIYANNHYNPKEMNQLTILTAIVTFYMILLNIVTINFDSYAQTSKEISIVSEASKLGDDIYQPNTSTIKLGDTIVWTNKDFGTHTVTENQGLFGSEYLQPDQTFEYTFNSAVTFDYHCSFIHL
jgi:plastocyanin